MNNAEQKKLYVPATIDGYPESIGLMRKFPFALQTAPDQVCGTAYRIGWAGKSNLDPAIYRLRLYSHLAGHGLATLPDLFVLEDGIFVEYTPAGSTEEEFNTKI